MKKNEKYLQRKRTATLIMNDSSPCIFNYIKNIDLGLKMTIYHLYAIYTTQPPRTVSV